MILFRFLIQKYEICNNYKNKNNQLGMSLLKVLFNDREQSLFGIQSFCSDGKNNKTGDAGRFWNPNNAAFCIKRLLSLLPKM